MIRPHEDLPLVGAATGLKARSPKILGVPCEAFKEPLHVVPNGNFGAFDAFSVPGN